MFCLTSLLGHIVRVTELMPRPSTRMATHGASTYLRVLLAMYGTLHRADTPKVKSRGVKPGELGVYSPSYLTAWKSTDEIVSNTSMAIPRCLNLLKVKSLIPIHYLLHGCIHKCP